MYSGYTEHLGLVLFLLSSSLEECGCVAMSFWTQTWKGMETRWDRSWQPRKSSVRVYRNIKTLRYKLRCNQGGKRAVSRKHSLAVREDCRKRAGLQLSPVGRLSTTMSRKLKSIKPSLRSSSLNKSTAWETRAARVSGAVGRARPPMWRNRLQST